MTSETQDKLNNNTKNNNLKKNSQKTNFFYFVWSEKVVANSYIK